MVVMSLAALAVFAAACLRPAPQVVGAATGAGDPEGFTPTFAHLEGGQTPARAIPRDLPRKKA
eukprot:15434700-Alexandrium_andersonii.AAC.1